MKNIFHHGKERSIFGQKVQQSWQSLYLIEGLLREYRPTFIVELGTGKGVLTSYFSMYSRLSGVCILVSADIDPPQEPSRIESLSPGCAFVERRDAHAEETIKIYCGHLNKAEKPFLLVDGKDPKSDELDMYLPHLRAGTPVFAHDFITNPEKGFSWGFGEDKINWKLVEKMQPWWDMSKEMDARLACLIRIGQASGA